MNAAAGVRHTHGTIEFVTRVGVFVAAACFSLAAQTPIVNTGQPIRVPFECTEADTVATGITCSEEDPCPVYLELANVEAVGDKLFLTGNLHTPTNTLYSVLLATEDAGQNWNEPLARIRASGLDQIQFFDFQTGWISGANLQGAPRDPFLLITTDGGKTWRQRALFEESRVASVERFWFESRQNGALLMDATLDNGKHELYETRTGGESWEMRQAAEKPIKFPLNMERGPAGWRLRPDAGSHSYAVERSQAGGWHRVASFLVNVGACKE
ncbi:MAG TPA: hypothetical protein VKX49_21005 [Bryobacteraceae bacterium]|nr:hypothetical protein [Bryobacteraceae bacterium]